MGGLLRAKPPVFFAGPSIALDSVGFNHLKETQNERRISLRNIRDASATRIEGGSEGEKQ